MRVFGFLRSRAGNAPTGAVAALVVAAILVLLVVALIQEPTAPTQGPATISAAHSPETADSKLTIDSAFDGTHFTIVAQKGTEAYVAAVSQLLVDKNASVDGGDPHSVVVFSPIQGSTDVTVRVSIVSDEVAKVRLSRAKMKVDIASLGAAMDRWDKAQVALAEGQGDKE